MDYRTQDSKRADVVWPIENVWDIVKDQVAQKKCINERQVRNAIVQAWRENDQDKALCTCRQLMGDGCSFEETTSSYQQTWQSNPERELMNIIKTYLIN